jgi:hypothetical protein
LDPTAFEGSVGVPASSDGADDKEQDSGQYEARDDSAEDGVKWIHVDYLR